MNEKHFRALEAMYQSAPFHNILPPVRLTVEPGACSLASVITSDLFHAGGSAHGFSFFRLLDDAAFFAAQSLETAYFLNTSLFSVNFLRPLTSGEVHCSATAEVRGKAWEGKAELFQNEKLCARAEGVFLKSRVLLSEVVSFRS